MSLESLLGKPKDWASNFFKAEKAEKKTHKTLRAVSEKREKENVLYERTKRLWRLRRMAIDGFQCEFVRDGVRCTKKADRNPHHRKRRGKYLADADTFMAVCRADHDWIESNGKEAEKLGYLIRERKP